MKRYISYFAVLLAVLLGAACSKDDSAAGSDNRTDVMAMTVSTRQTADTGEYDPLQHQTVYIYNDEGGLLRKYTSKEALSRTVGTVGRHLPRSGRSRRGSPRRFHETVIQGRGDVHRQTRRNHKRCGRLPNREHRRRGEIRRFDPPEPRPRLFRMDRRPGKRSTSKPPKRAASRRSGSRPKGRVITPCPQA